MTKYELYLADISGEHKPIVKFISDTPFMPATVGERFDDHGWDRLDGVGKIASSQNPKRYTVFSVKHTVLNEGDITLVQYWINLNPYHGPRSPAWGDK